MLSSRGFSAPRLAAAKSEMSTAILLTLCNYIQMWKYDIIHLLVWKRTHFDYWSL